MRSWVIAAAVLAGSPAWAQPYELMAARRGDRAVLLDRGSVRRSGEEGTVWTVFIFAQPLMGAVTMRAQMQFRCKAEQRRITYVVGMNEKGETITTEATPGTWGPVLPDSIEAALMEGVCAGKVGEIMTEEPSLERLILKLRLGLLIQQNAN